MAASFRSQTDYKTLLELSFLRETGVVSSMVCLDCDDPHDAQVVFEDGQYGWWCPGLGFVPVLLADVQGVVADVPTLINHLADLFDCRRRKTSPLQGATWRIGAVASEGGDVSLYFHPSLRCEQDVADLISALSREIRTPYRLILTAGGALPIPDAKTALLDDVIEFNLEQRCFVVLTDPRDIVDAPRKRLGGAPNRYKEMLIPLIESRMQGGSALPGRNEEAKAILEILRKQEPDAKLPSLPSVKHYVTKARGR